MAKHCRLAVINGHGDFRYGDCQITAAELAGSMATMGHRFTYHEFTEIMTDVDSNGDSVMRFSIILIFFRTQGVFLLLMLL